MYEIIIRFLINKLLIISLLIKEEGISVSSSCLLDLPKSVSGLKTVVTSRVLFLKLIFTKGVSLKSNINIANTESHAPKIQENLKLN